MVSNPGEGFSGYVVGKTLGRGGNATVYLAHRPSANDPVALKVLAEDRRGPDDLDRQRREYELPRRLDHAHIVDMYERGPYWLTMEYVDGGNASSLPGLELRLTVLGQIAEALDFAHRSGIVHCDVKPSNILVFKDFSHGGAVLIDFGSARSLAEDMAKRLSRDATQRLSLNPAKRIARQNEQRQTRVQASLPYAAPEILLGRMPSGATDEYALACTAVELITGAPPFAASTVFGLEDCHLYQRPPQVSRRVSWIPHAFDSILAKAMSKDPELRYDSCSEFVALITRVLH